MELWWVCLVVGLLYGPGCSVAFGRHRRQSDAWRSYQSSRGAYGQPSSQLGSPRRHLLPQSVAGVGSRRGAQPVSGWGSSRGLGQLSPQLGSSRRNLLPQSLTGVGSLRGAQPVSGWGSRYPGGGFQSRQLIQPTQSPSSPIRLQCTEDSMVVTVHRDLYGNGKLVKPSDLTLGSCAFGPQTTNDMVVFNNGLEHCGNTLEMTPEWLIYNAILHYTPTTSRDVPIIRTSSAVVPIQCFYPRHGNVSSDPIKPTWIPYSTTVTSEERLAFSLHLMTDDWSALSRTLVFKLGDLFYIEASVDIQNHEPMMLYVDSCVATLTPDMTSKPSYDIISNNGCLIDGMEEDSSSAFVSPRPQPNILRFMIDSFVFVNSDASKIFITCSLRAVPINQTPDSMNKACSYNKASSSWSPVEGQSGICQCCSSGNCAAGPGMSWNFPPGRPRGIGKRDVGSHEKKHGLAVLGPLLVSGEKSNKGSRAETAEASGMSTGQGSLQLWVLVAIGSVSAVVVAISLSIVGKCILQRFSHKESV